MIFLLSQIESFSHEKSIKNKNRITNGLDKEKSPKGQIFFDTTFGNKTPIIASKRVNNNDAKIVFLDI